VTDALINKYRPGSFEEVVGQKKVVASMANAVKKKLGNAFLLTGPSGTGKTTLAYIAAKMLGCQREDLLDVDAATNTGIDEMRLVMQDLMYKPLGTGSVKVIIVDEVHGLSKQAVTSLLKILEKPPSHVYWFLCTTEANKIPVAIKTRCLAYQLKEVSDDDLFNLLVGTEEGKELQDDVLDVCVVEARGSPRQALSNLGVCLTAKTKGEAAELLSSAAASPVAFDLAKALMAGDGWNDLRALITKLKEVNPESVRHVVRAYMTTVLLNAKGRDAESAFAILEAFSQPFNSGDGLSPLVLACGRLALGSDR
jgi:DNA polymerase-3 subunit gamma/tau